MQSDSHQAVQLTPRARFAPGAWVLAAAPRLTHGRAVLLIAGFMLLWLALQLLFALPILLLPGLLGAAGPLTLADSASASTSMTRPGGALLAIGLALGAIAALALCHRWGGPALGAAGLRREGTWAREIVLGMALGPLLFALVLALELACGWANVGRGTIGPDGLLLGLVGYTGVGVNEEVAMRGFVLQVLARAWNAPIALIASSGLFALLHGPNPNASPAAIAALVVAGLMLAWGYFATGRLWLPIAFHWSWNYAQGPLFGFPVSGQPNDAVLAVTPTGPGWATGGDFGPEAGMLGVLAEIVAFALILAWRRAEGSATATALAAVGGLGGLTFLYAVWR